MISLLPVEEVVSQWDAISGVLAPAFDRSKIAVLTGVLAGQFDVFECSGEADGYIVTSSGFPTDSAVPTVWLLFVAGMVKGGPKQRLAHLKDMLARFEAMVGATHFEAIRVETSRPWHRVLTGYCRISDGVFEKRV